MYETPDFGGCLTYIAEKTFCFYGAGAKNNNNLKKKCVKKSLTDTCVWVLQGRLNSQSKMTLDRSLTGCTAASLSRVITDERDWLSLSLF